MPVPRVLLLAFAPASAVLSFALASAVFLVAASAAAEPQPPSEPLPVVFGADEVRFDPKMKALEATGHVHVDEPPFHLVSDELTLRRVPIGAELEGKGKVTFCPCLGAPLAVRFTGATVAPPHDLILRQPVLEVFGVPIAWAPAFWLRSPGRPGLLPPDVAWRGADGLFLGGGVHVPWRGGDLQRRLDVRAGGYVSGGVAVEGDLRTGISETTIRWDRLHGEDGLGVLLRGSTAVAAGVRADSVAWSVDALRGARAVAAATDVEVAARPFDRAAAQSLVRTDGWSFTTGVRTVAVRGGGLGDLGAGGPVIGVGRAGALGDVGAYDAAVEAGAVTVPAAGTISFARGEGGASVTRAAGPIGLGLAIHGLGDVADDGRRRAGEGAAEARASLALPLARAYASAADPDPWVHRTEPRVEAAALVAHARALLTANPGRGSVLPDGSAWIAAAGWRNVLARAGPRFRAEVDASGGLVGTDRRASAALRVRSSARGSLIGFDTALARVLSRAASTADDGVGGDAAGPGPGGAAAAVAAGGSGTSATWGTGGAWVGRVSLGHPASWSLAAHVAERDGVDPLLARALVDAALEPSGGFLTVAGWTGGAGVTVPIGPRVTARAAADLDLDARVLVAAVGSVELHDPCGCVVLRASASRRIGRDGVDAWLSVDLKALPSP
ncbi:MAG: hypothetical protein JOZ69_14730 [Myxococcales bacterium]|nr:hypothetical protein [Myxococcales bacterium]